MSATRTIFRRALLTTRIRPTATTSFATRAQFQPVTKQINQPRHFSATKMGKEGVHNLASYVSVERPLLSAKKQQ